MKKNYMAAVLVIGLLWIGLILVLPSLLQESKTSQCNRLVAVVNQASQAQPHSASRTIAEDNLQLAQTTAKLEEFARQLESMKFSDPKIYRFRVQFIQHYRDYGRISKAVIEAPAGNFQAVRDANREFIQIQEREIPLVQDLNQYCR